MTETFRPVQSSLIGETEYDPLTGSLTVTFLQGGKATYKNVPPDVFENLKVAGSAGKYFHAAIKNQYKFERG